MQQRAINKGSAARLPPIDGQCQCQHNHRNKEFILSIHFNVNIYSIPKHKKDLVNSGMYQKEIEFH